ncbi:MAG: phosphoglycerate dehydrogenase [Chloroflexi bacterium]|nr:phosphoglycerate dehydrogenase [Chloroflexota bacterium]
MSSRRTSTKPWWLWRKLSPGLALPRLRRSRHGNDHQGETIGERHVKILVADPVAKGGIDLLRQHFEVDVKTGLKPEELSAIIGEYAGLVVRSETKVTKEIIDAGRRLQVIGRAGVGVDNIDVEAATQRGVVVVNAPSGNTISACEHTIALMMALARHVPQANAKLKANVWARSEFVGVEVRNKTLGIVGLGRIGSEVARRAKALEMRVLGYDPFVSQEHANLLGVIIVSLEDLLRQSDFITLHTPMTAATKGIIGPKELAIVKPEVRIINVARGGLVDEEALYKAVEEGRVAGAAIDVFSQEPAKDNVLFKSDKIIVTPHLGASTHEAQINVAVDVAEEIIALLQGKPARYAVNAPAIPPETLAVVAPFLDIAHSLGSLARQLTVGQPNAVEIRYEGEMAEHDTNIVRASVLRGILEGISDQPVNFVNAHLVAAEHGLRVSEHKEPICENYSSLITVTVQSSKGTTTVAGTQMRNEAHILLINGYWLDLTPNGGYLLLTSHQDRPGIVGAVGTLLGKSNINISGMQVSREKPRGQALMAMGVDEQIPPELLEVIRKIPGMNITSLVKI